MTFLVASFCGWIVDSAYRSVLAGTLVLSGPTYPPFYPSYGFGALLLYLTCHVVGGRSLGLRFVAYALVTTAWELTAGLVLTALSFRLWDYSENPLNFMGHVDVEHSFYWVLLGFAFERLVYPWASRQIRGGVPEPTVSSSLEVA